MKEQKIYYYSDEVEDDFTGTHIELKKMPENYDYFHKGFLRKLRRGIVYYCLARPVVFLYNKLIKRVKYVNKKVMKGYKKQGCFLYGNHTSMALDAFNPSYLAFPRPADVIVSAYAIFIKGIGWLIKDLGGLPIADSYSGMKKFNEAVAKKIEQKHWIAIYPEAHIWHYYTKIRPFASVSFAYPVRLKAPVFSYTMVYKKRKHSRRPKRVVYVDGPFFADETLPHKQAVQKLRDEVYAAMCKRAENSDCEYIKYVYRPKEENK